MLSANISQLLRTLIGSKNTIWEQRIKQTAISSLSRTRDIRNEKQMICWTTEKGMKCHRQYHLSLQLELFKYHGKRKTCLDSTMSITIKELRKTAICASSSNIHSKESLYIFLILYYCTLLAANKLIVSPGISSMIRKTNGNTCALIINNLGK